MSFVMTVDGLAARNTNCSAESTKNTTVTFSPLRPYVTTAAQRTMA